MVTRALTLVLAAAGCAPPTPREVEAPPAQVEPLPTPPSPRYDQELDGFMVLAPLAELFDAPSGTLRGRVPSSGFHEEGTVYALGRKGEFIEIETSVAHPTCRWPYAPILGAHLDLWVHVDDVLPVVSRPVRLEFADGTAMAVDPGTPVEVEAGIPRGVWIGRAFVSAPIPAPDVDVIFELPMTTRSGAAPLMLPDDLQVSLDGHPLPTLMMERIRLTFRGAGRGGTHAVELPKPQMLVYEWRPDADGAIVELRSRCAVFEARTMLSDKPPALPQSSNMWIPINDLVARSGIASVCDRGRYRARDGATVYWDTGMVAGTLERMVSFAAPGEMREGRRCFEAPSDPPMRLCVDDEDLQFEAAASGGKRGCGDEG